MIYKELKRCRLDQLSGKERTKKWIQKIEDLLEQDSEKVEQFIRQFDETKIQDDKQLLADITLLVAIYNFSKEDDVSLEQNISKLETILIELAEKEQYQTILAFIGTEYLKYSEYKLAIQYLSKLKDYYKENQDKQDLAYVCNNLSIAFRNVGNFTEALHHVKESIRINEYTKNKNLAYSYHNLAAIYYNLNSMEKALEYFLSAMRIAEEDKDTHLLAKLFNNIANIYNDQTDFPNAEMYYQKALTLETKFGNPGSKATILLNLGIVSERLENYTRAIDYFHQSMEIAKKQKLKKIQANNLGFLGTTYLAKKELEKALDYSEKAYKIILEMEDSFLLSHILIQKSEIYFQMNDFPGAEELLNRAQTIAENNHYSDKEKLILEKRIKLSEQVGDVNQICKLQKKYIAFIEENSEKNYSNRLAELKTIFELETKEKEAEMYRSKMVELKKRNEIINTQKSQLEATLAELRKSELSYEYVSTQLKENIGSTIIGKSKEIKNIIKLIKKVAMTPQTSVLITGETGTGKELIARTVHDISERRKRNFCVVNVSAVPESLFESEFFGYRKNSFTGAKQDKAGWCEIADKGTLFLDEIGTLDIHLQAKFLRVLENKKFVPIGSTSEITTDFRVISATNENLSKLIKENKFRPDLYHRVSTFIIHIPPLRDRIEDIPLLTEYFVKTISTNLGKKMKRIENKVISALMSYSFPGNVRELKNIIERAIILSNSSTLTLDCIAIPAKTETETTIVPLIENDKKMVLKALKATNFHQTNAAKLLKITPKSLERRMIKYGLKK